MQLTTTCIHRGITRYKAIKESGIIVQDNLSTGNKMARGFTYVLILVYFFIGVAIVADKMSFS